MSPLGSAGSASRLVAALATVRAFEAEGLYSTSVYVYNPSMRHIGSHLRGAMKKTRETERGEIMKYFCQRINVGRIRDGLPPVSMGRMGKMLQKIPTKDLYYIKRVCDDSANFSKKFWWLLDPKKHPEDKK